MTTQGRLLEMQFACSGYRAAADGEGEITFYANIDGFFPVRTFVYTNETLSHKATVARRNWLTLPAGTHSLSFRPGAKTQADSKDVCAFTAVEFPH